LELWFLLSHKRSGVQVARCEVTTPADTAVPVKVISMGKETHKNLTAVIEEWLLPENSALFTEDVPANPLAQV
jgi:hypothetical protein